MKPLTGTPQDAAARPVPPSGRRAAAKGAQPPRFSGRSRYSSFVGVMKLALPLMATALVLLLVAWPQLISDDGRFGLSLSRIGAEQTENLSMLNARFEGRDELNRPFSITADTATQASGDADLVDLEAPKADLTLEDGTWLALTARVGRYRPKRETLDLNGNVSLFHDQGFEFATEAASIDLGEGSAAGSAPVRGQGPAGELEAEGFRIFDHGERIVFTGKSRLLLYSGAESGEIR